MNIIVQTPRLLVREFLAEEVALLVELYKDARITKYLSERTEETTREVFRESVANYALGTGLGRWGIFDPANGEFMGFCILKPADSDASRIELGYVLAYNYWGRGIATELCHTLIAYGFGQKGLTEICACTHPENSASQNVLLKAGLVRDGNVLWHGGDLPFFRILAPAKAALAGGGENDLAQ